MPVQKLHRRLWQHGWHMKGQRCQDKWHPKLTICHMPRAQWWRHLAAFHLNGGDPQARAEMAHVQTIMSCGWFRSIHHVFGVSPHCSNNWVLVVISISIFTLKINFLCCGQRCEEVGVVICEQRSLLSIPKVWNRNIVSFLRYCYLCL